MRISPHFVYSVILKPKPLRYLTNRILLSIIPKSVNLPEGRLLLNQKDPAVSAAIAFGLYEPLETRLFRSRVGKGMVVVDVGANVGYYAVIAAGRGARVVAIEPEEENAAVLKKNMEPFSSAIVVQKAISDRSGTATLYLAEDNKGRHSLVPIPDLTGQETVKTARLPDILAELEISKVDIIKMDIEGGEPLALEGMMEMLREQSPDIFVECIPQAIRQTGRDPVRFLQILQEAGYCLYEMDEERGGLNLVGDVKRCLAELAKTYTNFLCTKDASVATLS